MFSTGEGTAKNEATGAAFYALAAQQGIASSAFNIGCIFAAGSGIARDEPAAVMYWLWSAAAVCEHLSAD
jgi:TPR repeat protein